jgi:hypothetical protein
LEAAVEAKSTSVVSAPERVEVACAFDDEVASVRADIAQAVELVVAIPSQKERLI